MAEDSRFRARTIRASTLALLRAAARGEAPPGRAEEWAELVGAGIATRPGVLRPRWQRVLTDAAQAPITLEVDSRLGRAGMRTAVGLTPRLGLAVTERRRLRVTPDEIVVEAVEDVVEVALFDPALTWPAVQRVLPPSATVRAEGGSNPREERTVAIIRDVPGRSALPEEVRADLASADVEVNLVLQVDHGTDTPFVTARHWLEGEGHRLHEVRLREGSVEVLRVPTGTIADEIAWLTVGAFDLRSRTGRAS